MDFEALGPIEHGIVIVLREHRDHDEDDDDREERYAETIEEITRVCGHTEFTVLLVDPTTEIELLDVDMMRAAGWYRSPGYSVPVHVEPSEVVRTTATFGNKRVDL